VFAIDPDPVQAGLVTSLNNPGGNLTGISTMNLDIGAKWVELMHELLPAATHLAVLANIGNAEVARSIITSTQQGARRVGLQTEVVFAGSEQEMEPALRRAATLPDHSPKFPSTRRRAASAPAVRAPKAATPPPPRRRAA
jgi:putative tryptophan/tyrosine transport system substrate-binding protein